MTRFLHQAARAALAALLALELAVVVLRAPSDTLVDLMALVPGLLQVLPRAAQGIATIVEL